MGGGGGGEDHNKKWVKSSRSSGGFQILGPWAIFYMQGPVCERREQLGVWGGGALKIFRF